MIAAITLYMIMKGHLQEQGCIGRLSPSDDGKFLKLYIRNLDSTSMKIYRPDTSSFVVSCESCNLRWPSQKNVIEPLRIPPVQDSLSPFTCKMYVFPFRQLIPTRRDHKLSIRVVNETPEMFPSHDTSVQLLSTSEVQPINLTLKNFRPVGRKTSSP